jgi:hypothetical protein
VVERELSRGELLAAVHASEFVALEDPVPFQWTISPVPAA